MEETEGSSKNNYFFKVCVTGEWGVGASVLDIRFRTIKSDTKLPHHIILREDKQSKVFE